jgi:hypothetical protein
LHIAVVNSKLSIAVGKLFNVVAGSVSRAIVGAGGSAATLSGVTLVTLAQTSGTITNSLVGALSVPMGDISSTRSINPSKSVVADTLRAISSLPVTEASTSVSSTTSTVTVAQVRASSGNKSDSNSEGGNSKQLHFNLTLHRHKKH